ncbi:MAG TPA: methyltransferase [Vicinamibacterales bacterium]|nr:methyltransferase [Vicinamibacterales bacterium]
MCRAGCLPRKELFESWETAKRVRRLFRGGRVVDVCGGHGLLGQVLILLDNSSPAGLVADTALPPSHAAVHAALVDVWPRLRDRVAFTTTSVEDVALEPDDLVVSIHACGALTDLVLARARAARARVAVGPCCHDATACDTGRLDGWLDAAIAIDVVRAAGLARADYRVWTQTIPSTITPQNRLLIGEPMERPR